MKLGFGLAFALSAQLAFANVKTGAPAPDFSVMDMNGKTQTLSAYKGKTVVLEWYNKDCPYVRKHYDSQNMQKLQSDLTAKGVVWLSVVSSAKGKQGNLSSDDAKKQFAKDGLKSTALLLDESGTVGKLYGAKTTPHMYVVDAKGILQYQGAIDSNDSADPKVIPTSENYVSAAVNSVLKGEKVAKDTTKPYGCGVKY